MMKFVLVIFLMSFSLVGVCTEAEDILKSKIETFKKTWGNFNTCMTSLHGDSDLSYVFTRVIALKNNPKRYELMQSTKFADQEDVNHLTSFPSKMDVCRNDVKSGMFDVDSRLGSLYTDSFATVDSILDAYALKKLNLSELNSKISMVEQETEKTQREILNNIQAVLQSSHSQEVTSSQNNFRNLIRGIGEAIHNAGKHQDQLEIESARNARQAPDPKTTDCYRNGDYLRCTTR